MEPPCCGDEVAGGGAWPVAVREGWDGGRVAKSRRRGRCTEPQPTNKVPNTYGRANCEKSLGSRFAGAPAVPPFPNPRTLTVLSGGAADAHALLPRRHPAAFSWRWPFRARLPSHGSPLSFVTAASADSGVRYQGCITHHRSARHVVPTGASLVDQDGGQAKALGTPIPVALTRMPRMQSFVLPSTGSDV